MEVKIIAAHQSGSASVPLDLRGVEHQQEIG